MKRVTLPEEANRRILAVSAGPGLTLDVSFEGQAAPWRIDVAPWIGRHADLAVLGADRKVFESVRVGEYGWAVFWGQDEERGVVLDSLHLWLLAQEQNGLPLTPEAFRDWRARHGLSAQAAAEAVGLSRRMVTYYESGRCLIPRTVALACAGWEARIKGRAA